MKEISYVTSLDQITDPTEKAKALECVNIDRLRLNEQYKTCMWNRGINNKQMKIIADVAMTTLHFKQLLSTYSNGVVNSKELIEHNDFIELLGQSFSKEFIIGLLNASIESEQGVTGGCGEILIKYIVTDSQKGIGDVNTKDSGILEIKGYSGALIGQRKYDVDKCLRYWENNIHNIYPSHISNGDIYKSKNILAKEFLKIYNYNPILDVTNLLKILAEGYGAKYDIMDSNADEQVNLIVDSLVKFFNENKEKIFKMKTARRTSPKHKFGDKYLSEVDTSIIIYGFMMADMYFYKYTDKWKHMIVLHKDNGIYDGYYKVISEDVVDLNFQNLYNYLITNGITWVTTGIDIRDLRKQSIKIQYKMENDSNNHIN